MDHELDPFDDAFEHGAGTAPRADDVETEFWSRVPEGRFARRRAGRSSAATPRPARRPQPAGSRVHHDDTGPVPVPRPITQAIPVVTDVFAGSVRQATRHVDPLIRRLGVAALVTALAVPVALSMRSDDPAAITRPEVAAAANTDPTTAPTTATTIEIAASASPWASIDVESLPPAVPVNPDPAAAPAAQATTAATSGEAATAGTTAAKASTGATAAAPAARTGKAASAPACGASYTVRSGDAWLLIASRAKVALKDLLAVNKATASTALYPGRSICLPIGAVVPTAPAPTATTAKPPTTTAPKPTTTTAAPEPAVQYSRAQVERIIRDVWPDHLEDRAVAIATRESNLNPGVRNFCCYGLFQIYYNVHRSWLANIGITSASKLYDPKLNAFAAYVLYLRSGSFAPWGG